MTRKVSIKIQGMDCASCVINIDGALEDLDGVKNAATNFAKEVTTIEYNPEKISQTKVLQTIRAVGYKGAVIL